MTDRNQRLIVYNKRFLDLFAVDPSAFTPGLPTDEIFVRLRSAGGLPAEMVDNIHLKQRGLADARQSGTFVVSGEGGQSISVSQRPIADGGWIATYEDVSEQRRAEEHIRFAAHHDALTKLPNRVLFRIRLDEMISNLAHRDTGLALLYLDLDRFKHVNDTLGHPIGDALLEAAGRRLLSCLRSADIVARLGGDEFAIAFESTDLPTAAELLGQRIISALGMPYKLAGHTVIVGASIGIALAGDGEMNADTLLKNADMALYQAKAQGTRGLQPVRGRHGTPVALAARDRGGPAGRSGAAGVRTAVPTALGPGQQPHRRLRGADPLEPPGPRHRLPRPVHPDRRGDRPDPINRRLGPEPGLHRCDEDFPTMSRSRSTCRARSSTPAISSKSSPRHWTPPGCRRTGWNWKSPKRPC